MRWGRTGQEAALLGAGALLVVFLVQALPRQAHTDEYKHQVHDKAGITLNCAGCHGGTKDGRIELPGKDQHKPCSNQGCHAKEFRKRDSGICTNCHDHNQPWRPNPVKRSFSKVSEFWVGFGHKEHKGRQNEGFACATCHPVQSGQPPRPADPDFLAVAHKDCAQCHGEFAKPAMTDCGGCHKLEGNSKPPKGSAGPQWRVAAKFEHETHQADPRAKGKALACESCHGNVLTVKPGERIPRPTMQGCATGCHNGEIAFKATGFACVKCHGPASQRLPGAPASQPGSQPGGR